MADPGINNNTDLWLRDVRDELRAIREILESQADDSVSRLQRPASSTDAETPAQPASQGKRAMPTQRKS